MGFCSVRSVCKWAAPTEFTVRNFPESHVTVICGHKLFAVYHPFKGAKCLHIFGDLVVIFNNSRPLRKEKAHVAFA